MNYTKYRDLLKLSTEIPVTKQDADQLFSNPAWKALIQMQMGRIGALYEALIANAKTPEQANVLRGSIMEAEALLRAQELITATAVFDEKNGKTPSEQAAMDSATFTNGLIELLGEENGPE